MTRLFAGTPFDIPPTCDRCGKLESECMCPPPSKPFVDPSQQTAKVFTERRKNKRTMTIVKGLTADASDLGGLLSQLQSACGAGGSVQAEQIEIQGDHLQRVKEKLKSMGYRLS